MRKITSPLSPIAKVSLLTSLLILLAIGLSACNSTSANTSNTNTATSTSVPSASVPSASVTSTSVPSTSVAGVQNCGTIRVALQGQGNITETQVEGNCFWHAYQQCQTASLIVNFTSLDTNMRRTFTTKPASQSNKATCQITDLVQAAILPQPVKTLGTYDCTSMNNTQQVLTIGPCGKDGDSIIPLK